MTWKLTHILGLTFLGFSFLDMFSIKDFIEAMPLGFRWTINFFSCVYIVFQALRVYEKYRSDRLDNRKKELEIMLLEQKLNIHKTKK